MGKLLSSLFPRANVLIDGVWSTCVSKHECRGETLAHCVNNHQHPLRFNNEHHCRSISFAVAVDKCCSRFFALVNMSLLEPHHGAVGTGSNAQLALALAVVKSKPSNTTIKGSELSSVSPSPQWMLLTASRLYPRDPEPRTRRGTGTRLAGARQASR